MKKRTIKECDVKSKNVLLRVDYDVPVNEDGDVVDDTKIKFSLETVKYLINEKAKIIILSHMGEPDGKVVKKWSLEPVKRRLEDILSKNILFAPSIVGDDTEEMIEEMLPGDILMLENTRFDPGEEKNASSLAKKLAGYADIFVNEAFSVCHKKYASVVGISKLVETYAGFRLQEEIEKMSNIFERIERPLSIVLGGSKIDNKIELIKKFVDKVDKILIGGEFANLVLYAMGYDLGEEYADKEKQRVVKDIIKVIKNNSDKIHLPVDVVVSDEYGEDAEIATIPIRFMHPKLKILDIGPQTVKDFTYEIEDSSTVVWSGILGHGTERYYLDSTHKIAQIIGDKYGNTVVGGSDTIEAMNKLDFSTSRFTHLASGGGAMLEYLQKGNLPGLENIPKVWGV